MYKLERFITSIENEKPGPRKVALIHNMYYHIVSNNLYDELGKDNIIKQLDQLAKTEDVSFWKAKIEGKMFISEKLKRVCEMEKNLFDELSAEKDIVKKYDIIYTYFCIIVTYPQLFLLYIDRNDFIKYMRNCANNILKYTNNSIVEPFNILFGTVKNTKCVESDDETDDSMPGLITPMLEESEESESEESESEESEESESESESEESESEESEESESEELEEEESEEYSLYSEYDELINREDYDYKYMVENVRYLDNILTRVDPTFDINQPNEFGSTLLMEAVRWRQDLALVYLLKYPGVDPNIQNPSGKTALHMTCGKLHENQWSYVPLLLQMGANPDIMCNSSKTPMIYAIQKNAFQTIKSLKNECGFDCYKHRKLLKKVSNKIFYILTK